MPFAPEWNTVQRNLRCILRFEEIEIRALPGDSFWSLSMAPLEVLVDAASVILDEVLPAGGQSDLSVSAESADAETYADEPKDGRDEDPSPAERSGALGFG